MASYRKVIVPVDLSGESRQIIAKAVGLCCEDNEIHLAYVQEPMDSVYLGVVPYGPVFVGMDQVESRLKNELESKLSELGEQFDIPKDRQHFLDGAPAKEIHRLAEEVEADLIVIGTHGQRGVQLLLGSTANSVLHGSACDVLAVRIKHESN